MDHQTIFNTVALHLLAQNARSCDNSPQSRTVGWCVSRGTVGRRCAAGRLIPDERYRRQFEGKSILSIAARLVLFQLGVVGGGELDDRLPAPGTRLDLVNRLQMIHDGRAPETWSGRLRALAADFGLALPKAFGPLEAAARRANDAERRRGDCRTGGNES